MIHLPPTIPLPSRRLKWLLSLVVAAVCIPADQVCAQTTDAAAPPAANTAGPSFRDLLIWSDILPQSLAEIPTTWPDREDERQLIEQVLYRLARAGPKLAGTAVPWQPSTSAESDPLLGDIIELHGRVTQVDRHARRGAPGTDRQDSPAEAAGQASPDGPGSAASVVVRCVMQLDTPDRQAVVWTNDAPWPSDLRLHERASFRGAFAGERKAADGSTTMVALADRIAWHPDEEGLVETTLGRRVLGGLGVDVGRLDELRHRTPLTHIDHEAFYSMLTAVEKIEPETLIETARRGLDNYVQPWREEIAAAPRTRQLLGKAVLDAAAEGRYSVAPLFLDAENQTGQLLLLEGVARRAIRIDADNDLGEYFELEIFTPDSQNLPIVCCVPSLPDGFPVGDAIRERVRVAGFFYKLWRYDSRAPRDSPGGPLEFEPTAAPLLIAAEPRWPLAEPDAASDVLAWITAGLFVAAVAVLGSLAWWWSRDHRRLRNRR